MMSSAMTEQNEQPNKNLESTTLIWLDKYVYEQQKERVSTSNNISKLPTRKELRSIINYLKVFDQVDTCQSYIESIDKQEHVVLIVSGTYGKEIIPQIHGLIQLRSIYIYCINEEQYQNWTDQYPKIRGVFNDSDHLLTKLNDDQKLASKFFSIPLTFFSRKKDVLKTIQQQKIVTKQNGQFLWFQLIIELLCNKTLTDDERQDGLKELADLLKQHYLGNEVQSKKFNDFQKDYEADCAIWLYSKEDFFYSVLNKALRTSDIDTIISFRIFINDMYQLLKSYYNDDQQTQNNNDINEFKVYRGQSISNEELEQMKTNEGEFISFNNFLSTTENRKTGLFFAESSGGQLHGLHRILFELQINSGGNKKPYIYASRFSEFSIEEEILFMIGSIFRIEKVYYEKAESVWIGQLTLMDEDSYELHDVFESLKKHKISDNSIINLANLLEDMGEYEKTENIIYRLLSQLAETHIIDKYKCYDLLGTIAGRNGDFEQAITYHLKSIELQKQVNPVDYKQLSLTYNNLGKSYGMNGQIDMALSSFFESNKIKSELFKDENHLIFAATYENIANCYFAQNKLNEAQEYFERAFNIHQKNNIPSNDPTFIEYYMSVGNIFGSKKQFHDAVNYHQKAIEIAQQVLPVDHPQLAMCYNNLGKDYGDQKQYRLARESYQEALNIYKQILPKNHPEIQRTQENLDELDTDMWTDAGKYLLMVFIIMFPVLLFIVN